MGIFRKIAKNKDILNHRNGGISLENKNYVNGPEIPMGLGMALAQNSEAMDRFSALPEEKKRAVIEHTHQIHSKKEMQLYAQEIAQGKI